MCGCEKDECGVVALSLSSTIGMVLFIVGLTLWLVGAELASRHAEQTLSPHRGQIPTARASCAPQLPSRRSETSVIDRATSAC